MFKKITKKLEIWFKTALKGLLLLLLPKRDIAPPVLEQIRKVLVFRLDQRIGNGIMLLPLLRAIRASRPDSEIQLLIHHPIADLFEAATDGLLDAIIPYNQSALMKRPWQYLTLIKNIRKRKFDVIITSHNPDTFSLSQAIFGRLCRPKWLIGFNAKESASFYNIAVASTTDKLYADAAVDLWRSIHPKAEFRFGGLQAPESAVAAVAKDYPDYADGGVLIWLGATGNKILPGEIFAYLYEQIRKITDLPIHFAAGPADESFLHQYPKWIFEKTIIWKAPLPETAAFFSQFSYFVSGDTGPMHLAAALNVPTLTIFVDSNIQQYGYQDGNSHFALHWRSNSEDRAILNQHLKQLFPNAQS